MSIYLVQRVKDSLFKSHLELVMVAEANKCHRATRINLIPDSIIEGDISGICGYINLKPVETRKGLTKFPNWFTI